MSELKKYFKAMRDDNGEVCRDIEIKHELNGYSPNIVAIGLSAFDDGNDACEAVEKFLNYCRMKQHK